MIKIIPSDSIILISYENVERCDDFFVDVSGTIEDFTGDVLTWSAFNKFRQINGDEKAMEMFEKFVKDTEKFCTKYEKIILRHPYFMILSCKSEK